MIQEPADENDNGFVIIAEWFGEQVSSLMFMFHLFLRLMKLLNSKSSVDQLLTTLLHHYTGCLHLVAAALPQVPPAGTSAPECGD